MNSGLLKTTDVLQAVLHHAIAPTSVALGFWNLVQPYLKDGLEQHCDPADLQPSPSVLVTASGQLVIKTRLLENEQNDPERTYRGDE